MEQGEVYKNERDRMYSRKLWLTSHLRYCILHTFTATALSCILAVHPCVEPTKERMWRARVFMCGSLANK